ncbi:hypothetical protein EGI22_04580 [Lacihabitans sp. LS3-19]|uniref:ATP-binding protein n=1 Tax=Lacihabitans sp. LS3-19 TaxID=2487335 RepID=UPI0020CB72E1|nr:ATP-binding protein [Lacihabitans sp. LS3-19]MCP9767174.1 hypothetical protein [Lacihabitans sp. LS3-19]
MKTTKHILILCLIFSNFLSFSQKITEKQIDSWLETWPVSDGSKTDSMLIWSELLSKAYNETKSKKAEAYAQRFKGLHYDYTGNPTEATKYYLEFLRLSKLNLGLSDQMSAASDLVYIYVNSNQLEKAKVLILSYINHPQKQELNEKKLSTFYNNLGVIYRSESKLDSAIYFYKEALKIKSKLKDEKGMANLRINLSALYITEKKYVEAEKLTDLNFAYLKTKTNKSDLWYNLINKAGALEGQKKIKESIIFLEEAAELAKKLESKSFQQQTIEQLSSLYANLKQHDKAFALLLESNKLKAEILNNETNNKIAELQENHNAIERERQNQLLNAQLEASKNRQLFYISGILSLLVLAFIVSFALYKNKKKNKLIESQNYRLNELNAKKNHLMSVVSHDLSSPFTAIKLWVQNLSQNSTKDLKEVEEKILETTDFGLRIIREILSIDKNEMQKLDLKEVDIAELLSKLQTRFSTIAISKNIQFKILNLQENESILTDKTLLFRALENLISNALKFTESGKEVKLEVEANPKQLAFSVIDQGPGIEPKSQQQLFEKYTTIKSENKNGDPSYGLGLNIVQRIAEELGGEITLESEIGKGSKFKFSLNIY